MLVIGESINSSRKSVRTAVEERDAEFIQNLAKKQVDGGAGMLDINVGTRVSNEPEDMEWLVNIVQEVVDLPLCIDSPNPVALERGLKLHKNGRPLVNSTTAEESRLKSVLPIVKEYKCMVVGLTMTEAGIPHSAEDRCKAAGKIIEAATKEGIAIEDIYIDPLVMPVSTDVKCGLLVIETLKSVKSSFPGIKTVMGLSNISFGLPNRKLINRTFLPMVIGYLDSAIMDAGDIKIMATLKACATILGEDDYCMEYITAYREGRLDV